MTDLKIYSTLSGQKEEFLPQGSLVKMYVCGVTPYSDAHIGHAMSYINFDVVRRYLKYRGYQLKSVQNFTDVDDKIIHRAQETGEEPLILSDRYAKNFSVDMAALNIMPSDTYPRVSQEIPEIIKIIEGLIQKNHAYVASNGDVYFRVSSMPDYGKLSNRNVEDMCAVTRVEIGEEKQNHMDFAVWKAAKEGEISWNSPWGQGRPGWHIECTAMALKYLGDEITIHGGGHDLVFPHHENEIAQSEGYTGKPFAKWWMHNGLLQMGGDKMSKSLGNLITIKDILKQYTSDDLRVFVLSSHYRKPLSYSTEILNSAAKGAMRLATTIALVSNTQKLSANINIKEYEKCFLQAMDDDFNSPRALAVLFDLARDINRAYDSRYNIQKAQSLLKDLGGQVLGLTFKTMQVSLDEQKLATAWSVLHTQGVIANGQTAIERLDNLLNIRSAAKQNKDWAKADLIRKTLADSGVE
ncbi:MAG: cysteine--tRNA ligase, partial [Chloroflexi bacterium]|nr:cysteine--tRNA ligase [Chloroflexota bacterium]